MTITNYEASYFTAEQGNEDAEKAINSASALGIARNTIIYFAVDFDAYDYQVTDLIIPYFEAIHNKIESTGTSYRIGVYGPRNICSRVAAEGYSCSSFVGDMSSGFSGNLGYSLPKNWAYDQITTLTVIY